MCLTLLVAGAGLAGSAISANASKKAARSQERAANNQIALERKIYDETSANFAPYREKGLGGFNALNFELGIGDRPEGYAGFQETPGYQFQRDQGTRAIEGSAAAGGNLRSGATMQALQTFGTGLANQEYGNHLNRLGGVAQMGQAAAGNQAAAGANFAQGAGNAMAAKGNAISAGQIGVGNAINGGITNALEAYQYNQYLNKAPAQNAMGSGRSSSYFAGGGMY